jgi:hypothetical protein
MTFNVEAAIGDFEKTPFRPNAAEYCRDRCASAVTENLSPQVSYAAFSRACGS